MGFNQNTIIDFGTTGLTSGTAEGNVHDNEKRRWFHLRQVVKNGVVVSSMVDGVAETELDLTTFGVQVKLNGEGTYAVVKNRDDVIEFGWVFLLEFTPAA